MTDPETDLGWAAVEACTLPTAERPLRVGEFDGLFAAALDHIEEPVAATAARLLLSGGPDLPERVRELTARESSCCSFFGFEVTELPATDPRETRVALDVEVPQAHTAVLAALVDRADGASRARAGTRTPAGGSGEDAGGTVPVPAGDRAR